MMTDKQGYAAMFHFLDAYYWRTKSDEMGGLLGAMSLLDDGATADAAMAHKWRRAVEHALGAGDPGKVERKMTEQQAYGAMLQFLNGPYMVNDPEVRAGLLETMSALADGLPADPAISGYWRKAVEYALDGGEAGKLELNK